MNIELFIFGVHGQFVWSAFLFTIISCLFLYLRTKIKLQNMEKKFSEHFEQTQNFKVEVLEKKTHSEKALSGSLI